MEWKEDLEMILTSVIGCNNLKRGFTLVEILVVLVVIGIASSLIFLNFSSVTSISKNQSTFTKFFHYLSEESIITGHVIGWHADNDNQFSGQFHTSADILTVKLEHQLSEYKILAHKT